MMIIKRLLSFVLALIMMISMMATLEISVFAGRLAKLADEAACAKYPDAKHALITAVDSSNVTFTLYDIDESKTENQSLPISYFSGTPAVGEWWYSYTMYYGKCDDGHTNEVSLDLDSSTTDIKDSKTFEQKYTLGVTNNYTDVTKVKLEWEITDIVATRKDAKKWDPGTLSWVDDNEHDVINKGEASATFTITNYSSVKVDAEVIFAAESDFNPTVSYTGVDSETHKTTIGTVVMSDKSVNTEAPHSVSVTVTITPSDDDFATKQATSSATKYGSYTVTISKLTPVVVAPTKKTLNYNTSAQELITAGSTTAGTLMYAVGNVEPADSAYSTAIPTATNAGTYTVWYKSFENIGYKSTEAQSIEVTIGKLTPTVESPVGIVEYYNFDAQELISAGSTNGGTLKYSISDNPLDDSAYSTTIPSATAPGEYTVWYKVFGDDNCDSTIPDSVDAIISKLPVEVTNPTANELTYTGAPQELVARGSTNHGTLKYAVGTDEPGDNDYSDSIPTATDAGTYTVWFKSFGDAIYVDSDAESVEVVIDNNNDSIDCLAAGTKITMADGTLKNVEDIGEGDEVLTYNHEKGEYEAQKVYLAWACDTPKRAFTLHFTNDIDISVIGDHCFFEKESLSYVAIFGSSAESFIGKHFYNATAGRYEELLSVTYEETPVDYYEIYTEYNANCIAEGLINVAYDSSEVLNIYKFNEDLTIDHDQLASDIDEFGIFEYVENERYSKELYDALGWKYVNVMIGKGFGTMETFHARANAFLSER